MKHANILVILVCCTLSFLSFGASAVEEKFGLNSIPKIKNKRPLTIVLEKGFAKIFRSMIEAYEKKTDVKVKVVEMELGQMYRGNPKVS